MPRRHPSNDSVILRGYSALFFSQVSMRLKRWRWYSHPKKARLLKSNLKTVLSLSSSWRVPHRTRAPKMDSRFFLIHVSTRQTEEKGSSALKRRLSLHGSCTFITTLLTTPRTAHPQISGESRLNDSQ